jgi:uncharacterized membrane protein YeaQ/YmgE (transglycosylase-associated protein family)
MESSELIALLILGVLAGSAAASVMKGFSKGPKGGWVTHTALGVAGALVGGLLFSALDIEMPEILSGTIEVADMFVAFIGAIVVIFVWGLARK